MTTLHWSLSGHHVINVKHYGAVGDFVNDDTAAIQSAISAAFGPPGSPPLFSYNGGNAPGVFNNIGLYFPRGHYRITAPLQINHTSGVRVFGDGKLNTIIENVSTDTTKINDQWDFWNDFFINRTCFTTDGFSFSDVRGMTLKCNGGIGFNQSWARHATVPGQEDTVSSQHVSFTDIRCINCAHGMVFGNYCIPYGGIRGVSRTANFHSNTTVDGLSTTSDIAIGMHISVVRTPFVPFGGGVFPASYLGYIYQINGPNSVEVQNPAVVTESNVPVRIGYLGEMSERNMVVDCDFINCSGKAAACANANSVQNCFYNCRFDSCGWGIYNGAGTNPTVYGCKFHNTANYDYFVGNVYTNGGDSNGIAACYSDSLNFALFHAGAGVYFSGIIHDNAGDGIFASLEASGIGPSATHACTFDGCFSRNGKIVGNGKFYGRANTFLHAGGAFASGWSGTIGENI